jgi:hypothetical protein
MNKEFIPYEQILELKELGFNGILWQEAFRWFREKYGLYYKIHGYSNNTSFVFDIADGDFETYYDECPTYEEAELACLKKLIEIVKIK